MMIYEATVHPDSPKKTKSEVPSLKSHVMSAPVNQDTSLESDSDITLLYVTLAACMPIST